MVKYIAKAIRSKTSVLEEIPCNLCGCDKYVLLFKARDLNYRTTAKVFNIVKCNNCGLVFINPQPEHIEQYYPETYGPHRSDPKIRVKESLRKTLELFYKYPVKTMESHYSVISRLKYLFKFFEVRFKNDFFFYRLSYGFDKKILDIGCGNGSYLLSLKAFGWDPSKQLYGIDFPSENLKKLKENKQMNITEGNFIEVEMPINFFEVITLRHVLEHFTDPSLVMNKIYRLLKPGGKVLINVPNFKSIESLYLFKENYHAVDAPRHLYHFTPETLKMLLQKTGFTIEKIYLKKSPTPFVISLQNYGYTTPKWVEKYFISNILTLLKILGYSGEILCVASKDKNHSRL